MGSIHAVPTVSDESLEDFAAEYEKRRLPFDPETLEEYVRQNSPRMADVAIVQHLADIIQSEDVSNRVMSMQWHMGRIAGLHHLLLTSDRPLVMTNGIARPDSHIVMPLSPEHILIMTNTTEEADKIKTLSNKGHLAMLLNDRMARQARKFVYGRDAQQLRFVENRLGEKAICSPFG
jgi:hypothetical protein